MNVGKTLFAQVIGYVALEDFRTHHRPPQWGAGVRTLDCTDLFRVMAFSQLTWREPLLDAEVCLTANQSYIIHLIQA